LKPDSGDVVEVGRLSLFPIQRGDRMGIRLKDPESAARKAFHGLDYFPSSPAWRITARWVAEPREIPILNVLGQTESSHCPGYAAFRIGETDLRLYPILEAPDAQELFYIFRDQTSGRETYAAGRFLDSALPRNGIVVRSPITRLARYRRRRIACRCASRPVKRSIIKFVSGCGQRRNAEAAPGIGNNRRNTCRLRN
jgi:hypothetical protein